MLSINEIKKILVIGSAGGLAQITVKLLSKHYPEAEIIGIDARPSAYPQKISNFKNLQMKYTRGNFEKIFRDHNFDVVFHLARITHASNNAQNIHKRLDLGVMGTNKILDLSLQSDVKKVILLSTFHVYGAYPDNPVFLKEDAPLRASIKFPDLRDVVEMDQIATSWMWKNQNRIRAVVLRPCNIIGPQIKNAISKYLCNPQAPYAMDFNPIFQFIHEYDMASILVRSVNELPTGVYNVATDDFIGIREAIKHVGGPGLPVPLFLLGSVTVLLKKMFPGLPEYLVDYIKFSCLIDNSEIKKHLGENFWRFKVSDTLRLLKLT